MLAQRLVEERLAACANILPGVRSIYRWEGAIQDEAEVLLLIKTRLDLVDKDVVPFIRTNHPYQEPEIIALPIEAGSSSYLEWLVSETKS
jgi:periplasmic divalent cation tolerance protein